MRARAEPVLATRDAFPRGNLRFPCAELPLPSVAGPSGELADRDHGAEDQGRDQHPVEDVLPVGDGVVDHAVILVECRSSAAATASSPGAPPSARAAVIHASPSPVSPAARSAAQHEISSAMAATASTPPSFAIRTRPCA